MSLVFFIYLTIILAVSWKVSKETPAFGTQTRGERVSRAVEAFAAIALVHAAALTVLVGLYMLISRGQIHWP